MPNIGTCCSCDSKQEKTFVPDCHPKWSLTIGFNVSDVQVLSWKVSTVEQDIRI